MSSSDRPQMGVGAFSPSYAPAGWAGDPGVARRAAIALALTLPWIGLPVGWIFMMMEDGRRQAVGRVCAIWSAMALVLHLLLMMVMAQAMGALAMRLLLPAMSGAMQNSNTQNSNRGGLGGNLNGTGLETGGLP